MEGGEEWLDQTLEQIITQTSASLYTNNSYPFSETDLQLNTINKDYVAHENVYRVRYLLDEQSFPTLPAQSPTSYNQIQNCFRSQIDPIDKTQPYNYINSIMDPNEEEECNSSYTQQVNPEEDEDEDDDYVGGDGSRFYGSDRGKISDDGAISKDSKRKRNTAASARFRIKKKQKERELQKIASEMMGKASKMEIRVHELEREIKWLKALIVEKNDSRLKKACTGKTQPRAFLF